MERVPVSQDLAAAALAAARAVARARGLPADDPRVLADGANLVVHLAPAPVVAKVAASSRLVREAPEWLARELEVASAVRAAGVAAVAPSPMVEARVHEHDGVAMTFWELVPPGPSEPPAPEQLGAMLAGLHAALRASRLALPRLAPLDDVPRFLARAAATGALAPGDRARLAAAYERLTASVAPGFEQPLHGDAHPGNLLAGPAGWLWCDFEDTCHGPVEWDLAIVRRTPRLDGAAAMRGYARATGREVDDAALAPWIELRRLHVTVWYCLYAERIPALRPRAEELVASWRAG
jgi:Ser/Thr protein kinase RdoA (MazF antagonist)